MLDTWIALLGFAYAVALPGGLVLTLAAPTASLGERIVGGLAVGTMLMPLACFAVGMALGTVVSPWVVFGTATAVNALLGALVRRGARQAG